MSAVLEAWDNADFEAVASQKLQRHRRKDIRRAIREARYATRLFKSLEECDYVRPDGQKQANLQDIKVVTILHASLPNHTGGYTGRAQGLLKGLQANGLQISAYTRPGFYSERVNRNAAFPYPSSNVDGVVYRHLPTKIKRSAGEYEYMYAAVEWYRSVFLFEKPSVVHARSTYLISLPALIAAHQLKIPVLYEVSGLWELVYEGRDEVGRAKRTAAMEDMVCRYADRVVSMNRSIGEHLVSRNTQHFEFGVVPNAVDVSKFEQISSLKDRTQFTFQVGYVGSLVDYEGLDTLIDAVRLCRERGTDIRAKIVGRGNELEGLRERAKCQRVEDLVSIPGPVPADQAAFQFDDVNVIVLPRKSTPATECVTPLKPYESMAAGRPLLVSNVKALHEVANEGQYAETFESGNADDLANNLIKLLEDRERQLALTEAAKHFVTNERNWTVVGQDMVSEIQSVAGMASSLEYVPKSRPSATFQQLRMGKVFE